MTKPYDTRLVSMVAQEWFETADLNQFCKLIPIAYVDGIKAHPTDFPNDGEVWWMLTSKTARFAEPGRLLSASVEDSIEYHESDPTKSRYQARRDSVRDLDAKEGCEVIQVPAGDIGSIGDIVEGFRLDLSVAPTPIVMLHWRDHMYGPFSASVDSHGTSAKPRYQLAPSNTADMTVYRIAQADFDEATKGYRIAVADKVSSTKHRRGESYRLVEVKHDLVLADGLERALGANATKIVLEPIDRKLVRYAKQCLTRKKKQALSSLLDELELTGQEIEESEDLSAAIRCVRETTAKQDSALDTVARALLELGFLGDDRIARAERAFAEKFIQERTAELQASVEEQLEGRRADLRRVEHRLKDLETTLAKQEAQRRKEFNEQLAADRARAEQELQAEQEALAKRRMELERQETALQQNLQKVTADLRDAGDEVVNRFLTIAPLLNSLGLGQQREVTDAVQDSRGNGSSPVPTFEVPAFVSADADIPEEPLSEREFFGRFQSVVEDSGFTYRPLDLQRFHISVKCGDLTVLGGPAGTGKSSLPVLYAQALLGNEANGDRTGCLMVNINPSWMDARDLVGHVNTIEGRFYPAESGLFQHLACAREEFGAHANGTGIYLVCLDEMNLSQVEHYFSDFMMALERKGEARAIRCFSNGVVGNKCPFRDWATIEVSRAIRFVGTVNFDETTRLLSDRFLDRVDLIQLEASTLPSVSDGDVVVASATGRMVTLRDMESWRSDKALPAGMASVLDQIRPQLSQIGCPISPRVYRAVCRFVGSAGVILDDTRAFDVQLAQRVIPKIRTLITGRQIDALDELIQILDQSSMCSFDESLQLLEQIRHTAGSRAWDLEE